MPDGHAKCCQRYALARQNGHGLEHAIWKRHAEDQDVGLNSRLQAATEQHCSAFASEMQRRTACCRCEG